LGIPLPKPKIAEANSSEEFWRIFLSGADPTPHWERRILRLLPSDPRCKQCHAPFRGLGARLLRLTGRGPSRKNPRFCNVCEVTLEKFRGGAEIPMSFLFADIRGSTRLAESMTPAEFSALLNRFYRVANRVLVESDALVDKLVGDEVIGFFTPWLTDHPKAAVSAAQRLLAATGHADPQGPWVPVGIGVHTGEAFYGVVGSEDTVTDVTALGDNVNITARLAQLARAGEILVTDAAAAASGVDLGPSEHRTLELKGRTEPVGVHVVRVTALTSTKT